MDTDVFPNDLDFWGPNGMANIRNVQIRYMPIQGDSKLTIALEKPGATADEGVYTEQLDLQNVKPHFTLPNLTAGVSFMQQPGDMWNWQVCLAS